VKKFTCASGYLQTAVDRRTDGQADRRTGRADRSLVTLMGAQRAEGPTHGMKCGPALAVRVTALKH